VWTRPELFRLDARGEPAYVAGVPPDYFSATGQLWGNPLYDWEAIARDGWRFWIDRMQGTLALFDRVRLDHFRGFEAYWEIPAGVGTAERGRWVPGPGAGLFQALENALGVLPFLAENLGVITPEVEALRRRFGFPGMAVLQFAFGNDPQAESFLPHNYDRDLVAYTGTHDNDTAVGWWTGGAGESVRSGEDVAKEKAFARAYLATDGHEMSWTLARRARVGRRHRRRAAPGRPRPRLRGADEHPRHARAQLAVAGPRGGARRTPGVAAGGDGLALRSLTAGERHPCARVEGGFAVCGPRACAERGGATQG
jgi:4-alpha-glucanotransferase